MAGKDRSTWSEAYRRRIERAEAAGKSRQSARGHKQREHVQRKAREISLGYLTSSQRQSVRKFAAEQAKRSGDDVKTTQAAMLEWATLQGFARFQQFRDAVREMSGQYRRSIKRGTYESHGLGLLEMLAREYQVDNEKWFYYH